MAMFALMIASTPALGGSYFFGQVPPPQGGSLIYRNSPTGPVKLGNAGIGSFSSLGISAELYRYDNNPTGGVGGYDTYTLRVLGEANARLSHKYRLIQYGNFFDPCGGNQCTASGITTRDQGIWFYLGFTVYFYGRAFDHIFVCANGWAAFEYEGSNSACDHTPQTLPTPDYKDSNGNIVNTPDAIIAPLWKNLDPSVMGQIKIYQSFGNTNLFGVWWDNIVTTGTQTRCLGGWCQNSFSFSIDSTGRIRFGYYFVDSADPWNKGTVIGVEDPAGVFGQQFVFSTIVNAQGALLIDDNYLAALLHRARIVVDKLTSDTSYVDFDRVEIAGYNIRTTNSPAQHDPSLNLIGDIVVSGGVELLCAAATIGFLGCLVIGVAVSQGIAWLGNYLDSLKKPQDLAQFRMPGVNTPPMSPGDSSAFLETPVQDERLICGTGQRIDNTGYFHDCDVDAALYDTLIWHVPPDGNPHSLRITFTVNSGAYVDSTSPVWDSTSVELTVAGNGVALFSDQFNNAGYTTKYWTLTGPWSLTGSAARYGPYNTGSRNSGSLTSPVFKVHYLSCSLKFNSWFDTRLGPSRDLKYVQVSTDRGGTWSTAYQISDATDYAGIWTPHTLSVAPFLGADPSKGVDISVRFFFDSVDGTTTNYGGWYVDDFSICQPLPPPDFTVSAPCNMNMNTGGSSRACTVVLRSQGGWSGTASLSVSVTPTVAGRPTGGISPASVSLSINGQATSTVTVTSGGGTGTFTVTVTATSGALSHTASFTVTVTTPPPPPPPGRCPPTCPT